MPMEHALVTKRSNPFQSIYEACNAGNSKEKLASLPDFPRLLDIEATNSCNFRCLMCPTGNHSMRRKTGFMSDEVYFKIINEIKKTRTPLRFIQWGEPLLHPRITEFLCIAHGHGILTHLNTNGSKLSQEIIEELIGSGLDSIKFSFQGVDAKGYLEMRSTDFFDELMYWVKLFWDIRGGRDRPYIHVSTTITYESLDAVSAFKEHLAEFVDYVSVGRTMLDQIDLNAVKLRPPEVDRLRWLKEQESVVKVHPECPEVFDKMSINWDGSVAACCADADEKMIVGSVLDTSLRSIWHNEKMSVYRNKLADMRHDELELCRNCWDYQSLQIQGIQGV